MSKKIEADLIEQAKALIESMSVSDKLAELKYVFGEAKSAGFEFKLASKKEEFDEKQTLAEKAISIFIKDISFPFSHAETLLGAIDLIFTEFPQLIIYINSVNNTPLLHQVLINTLQSPTPKAMKLIKELFELFYNHGADFNIHDPILRRNIIHVLATKQKHSTQEQLLPVLIKLGAGINRINAHGQTPFDLSHSQLIADHGGISANELLGRGTKALEIKFIPEEKTKTVLLETGSSGVLNQAAQEWKVQSEQATDEISRQVFLKKHDVLKAVPPLYLIELMMTTEMDDPQFILSHPNLPVRFDPHYFLENGENIVFNSLYYTKVPDLETKHLVEKCNIRRFINYGFDVSTQNKYEKNIFDVLADEKRISVFLADPCIRAALLSSTKIPHSAIRNYLSYEKRELVVISKSQEPNEAKINEEKIKFNQTVKALIAQKKSISDEEKAKSFIEKILMSSPSDKLDKNVQQTLFLKNKNKLAFKDWQGLKKIFMDKFGQEDHRVKYIDNLLLVLVKEKMQVVTGELPTGSTLQLKT